MKIKTLFFWINENCNYHISAIWKLKTKQFSGNEPYKIAIFNFFQTKSKLKLLPKYTNLINTWIFVFFIPKNQKKKIKQNLFIVVIPWYIGVSNALTNVISCYYFSHITK